MGEYDALVGSRTPSSISMQVDNELWVEQHYRIICRSVDQVACASALLCLWIDRLMQSAWERWVFFIAKYHIQQDTAKKFQQHYLSHFSQRALIENFGGWWFKMQQAKKLRCLEARIQSNTIFALFHSWLRTSKTATRLSLLICRKASLSKRTIIEEWRWFHAIHEDISHGIVLQNLHDWCMYTRCVYQMMLRSLSICIKLILIVFLINFPCVLEVLQDIWDEEGKRLNAWSLSYPRASPLLPMWPDLLSCDGLICCCHKHLITGLNSS